MADWEREDFEPSERESKSAKQQRTSKERERESIERIKARAIANGTMRADPEVVIRRVDPATLRPPKPKEKPVSEDRPSSEALRGRPGTWNPPKREKECKRCHLPFVPRSGAQRYCDREECRTKECERPACDNRFEIQAAKGGDRQKFCSVECSNAVLHGDGVARDSNPEQEPEALPGAPGPRGPDRGDLGQSPEPIPDSRAESPPEPPPGDELGDQEPSSAGSSAAPEVPSDSSQETADGSTEPDRYVELLYRLIESEGKQVPTELRAQALEQLHELRAP